MFNKANLSIVILNYNTRELLKGCLESIRRAERDGFVIEVIVVDNASQDGSTQMVEREFREVILVKSQKNLGFSAGNNLGIPKAKGEYVLFLNPDTVVSPETLREMLKFMQQKPEVGAATCRVELADGRLDEASHRGFPTPWRAFCYFSGLAKLFPRSRFFAGYTLGHLSLDKIHEIDSGTGAFLLVRREAGQQIACLPARQGWWDEDYFWYGEDLDFCYRLKEKGWQVMFVPITKILHYRGVASGIKKHTQEISTATQETKRRATRASIEAMRIFYKKHYLSKYPRLITWVTLLGINFLEKIRLGKIS